MAKQLRGPGGPWKEELTEDTGEGTGRKASPKVCKYLDRVCIFQQGWRRSTGEGFAAPDPGRNKVVLKALRYQGWRSRVHPKRIACGRPRLLKHNWKPGTGCCDAEGGCSGYQVLSPAGP